MHRITLKIALISIGLAAQLLLTCNIAFAQSDSFEQTLDSEPESQEALTLENIDQYLASSERQFSDLVDGAEKTVRWFDGVRKKRSLAIVYVHGFSASRQELSPVTEDLADKFAANVFYTRLSGHGRSDDAMAEASVEAWKEDIIQAYNIGQLIGDRVILISTSTGATLATWLLAQSDTTQPMVNIMISPNYEIQSSVAGVLRWSWGLTLAKWITGDYRSFTPVSEQHGKYWTERYPIEAVVPMIKLLDEVEDLDKSKINSPQLLIYSPQDMVINVDKVISTSKEFTAADVSLHAFTNSTDHVQHVLAGIACSPESTDSMVDLMRSYILGKLIN